MSLVNAKISHKLLVAFAVLIATMSAAGLANWWGMASISRVTAEGETAESRTDALRDGLAALVEEQNAVRGFVANRDPSFLAQRRNFQVDHAKAFARFSSTLADPSELALGRRLAATVDQFETDCDTQIADARSPATLDKARRELSTIGGLAATRQVARSIVDIEHVQLVRRSDAQRQAFAIGGLVLAAGGAVAIALALLMGWLLTNMIARPVAALTRVMLRLAGGDHSVETPAQDRRDEIGDMARALSIFRDAVIENERLEAEAATLTQERLAHEALAMEQQLRIEMARVRELQTRRWAEMAEEIAGVGHWRRNVRTDEGVWSEEMFRIYGFDPAEGIPPMAAALERFHPDDRAQATADYASASGEGASFARDLRIVRPDGEVRYVMSRATAERDADGAVCAVVGVLLDVTEPKRAEQVLRQNEERYRLLAENATDMIFQMDLKGHITFITPACQRMLGRAPEEMIGKRMLNLVHPDDASGIEEVVRALAAAGPDTAPISIQFRARHKDGQWVWIEGQPKVLFDASGKPYGIQDSVRDISERKAAEERQILLVHELNHRVKNTLATVQSVAMQTQRSEHDPVAFVQAFNARVAALSHSHDLLTQNAWSGASVRDLVVEHVRAHQGPDGSRFRLAGPDVRVSPKAAVALGMALGELATNAAKYGALSADEGQVSVSWETLAGEAEPRLRLVWRETGGPPVSPPSRRGFGSRLIERGLSHELGGSARLAFEAAGASCEIEFPLLDDAA